MIAHRLQTAVVAALLATLALVRYGLTDRGVVAAGLAAVLVVLAAIDLQTRLIPNRIVLPSFAIVLAAQIAFFPDQTLEWVLAAFGAAAFLALPLLVSPEGIGMGDLKLALLMGAGLGLAVIDALLYGSLAGAVAALVVLRRSGWAARRAAMPFGPFLALGGIIAIFTGHQLGP